MSLRNSFYSVFVRVRCVYLVLVRLAFVSLLIAANEMSGRLCVSGLNTCLYYPKVSLSDHLVHPLTLPLLHMGNQCAPLLQEAPGSSLLEWPRCQLSQKVNCCCPSQADEDFARSEGIALHRMLLLWCRGATVEFITLL